MNGGDATRCHSDGDGHDGLSDGPQPETDDRSCSIFWWFLLLTTALGTAIGLKFGCEVDFCVYFGGPHFLGGLIGFVAGLLVGAYHIILAVLLEDQFSGLSPLPSLGVALGITLLSLSLYTSYEVGVFDEAFWVARKLDASSAMTRCNAVARLGELARTNDYDGRARRALEHASKDAKSTVRLAVARELPLAVCDDPRVQVRREAARSPHLADSWSAGPSDYYIREDLAKWIHNEQDNRVLELLAERSLLTEVNPETAVSIVTAWFRGPAGECSSERARVAAREALCQALERGNAPIGAQEYPVKSIPGLPDTWAAHAVFCLSFVDNPYAKTIMRYAPERRVELLIRWIRWCVSYWPSEVGVGPGEHKQVEFLVSLVRSTKMSPADTDMLAASLRDAQPAVRSAISLALAQVPGPQAERALCNIAQVDSVQDVGRQFTRIITEGKAGTEGILARRLQTHPDIKDAEALLNCDNPWLAVYAREWLYQRGYGTLPGPGMSVGEWGGSSAQ